MTYFLEVLHWQLMEPKLRCNANAQSCYENEILIEKHYKTSQESNYPYPPPSKWGERMQLIEQTTSLPAK